MACGPGEQIAVDIKFSDYAGKFVLHCHVLEREDDGMMTQFQTVRAAPLPLAHSPARSRSSPPQDHRRWRDPAVTASPSGAERPALSNPQFTASMKLLSLSSTSVKVTTTICVSTGHPKPPPRSAAMPIPGPSVPSVAETLFGLKGRPLRQ